MDNTLRYLKLFETHEEYEEYMNEVGTLPNVSYCEDNKELHYNPMQETKIIATYNVKNTSSYTHLTSLLIDPSVFLEMEIDGEVLSDIAVVYIFNTTGEHTVKYTLADPTAFGNETFLGSDVASITIPNSVTTIGESAFSQCTRLTNVTIPNSVTSIGTSAFSQCEELTNVIIPNSVTTIGNEVFSYCSGLTNVTIPNSVTIIGNSAFYGCESLTSITIPNSVTSIGQSTFGGCVGLTNVTIPNGVTSIGTGAFSQCTGLTNVTIPNSVTSIGTSAFYACTGLTSITSLATTAPTIDYSSFQLIGENGTLNVPSGSTGYDAWIQILPSGWTKVEQ